MSVEQPPCRHEHLAEPPPGKYLRVCLDCLSRVLECTSCDAVAATPGEAEGWTKGGTFRNSDMARLSDWYRCPRCT